MLPRAVIIDGSAVVVRAFFAPLEAQLEAPDGTPTTGVFMFLRRLRQLAASADWVAVAWDSSRESLVRRQWYPPYKAARDARPADPNLGKQFSLLADILTRVGVVQLRACGWEADDVMASAVAQLRGGPAVALVTSDKDLHALVCDDVTLLDPLDPMRAMGLADVEARWGVRPQDVPLVLALMGDASDGVPGIRGIGEVTAKTLVRTYRAWPAMVCGARDGELSPALAAKIIAADADGTFRLMERLMALNAGLEIDTDLDAMATRRMDWPAAEPLLRELGFSRV